MLRVNQLIGFGRRKGIVPGPKLWLDVNDYASGQTWADRSGNGYDFYRGSGGSSDGADPTHNAGPPAYWGFDGGDYFSPVAGYSGSLLRKIGRQDQAWTLEAWLYRGATANTDESIFTSMNSVGTSKGTVWMLDNSSNLPSIYSQGSYRGNGSGQVGVGAWKHVALTAKYDGSQTCTHYLQGAANGTFTYNDTTFTSGDSDGTPGIGTFAINSPSIYFQNGTRLAIFRAYDRILTAAEILQNFTVERGRFGV